MPRGQIARIHGIRVLCPSVITSFGDAATEDVWNGLASARARKFGPDVLKGAFRKLDAIHAAAELSDLAALPGNRLEALKGALAGFHSVRVNDQWRIVFRWDKSGAAEVRLTDYH